MRYYRETTPEEEQEKREKAIEYIKKGFYATNQHTDNPELLLNAILIKEGLLSPEVANLSDTMSAEQIVEFIIKNVDYSGIKEWELQIKVRRDMEDERSWRNRGYGDDRINLYKSYIITGRNGEYKQNEVVYANESTVLEVVKSVQRQVAKFYLGNQNWSDTPKFIK